jgi:hypothetical protein
MSAAEQTDKLLREYDFHARRLGGRFRSSKMITAAACRRQAALYFEKARNEESTAVRTTLLDLNRSCMSTASQMDRLAALENEVKEARSHPANSEQHTGAP